MSQIYFDVNVSIDGFIGGTGGDISMFPDHPEMTADYLARLQTYGVAIMGRRTYELGYRFGLAPGANPYPAMRTIVFSKSLSLPGADVEVTAEDPLGRVSALKQGGGAAIYLCGGGDFAGALARAGLIDVLRLKRSPIIVGYGVRLFGGAGASMALHLVDARDYGQRFRFDEYAVVRPAA